MCSCNSFSSHVRAILTRILAAGFLPIIDQQRKALAEPGALWRLARRAETDGVQARLGSRHDQAQAQGRAIDAEITAGVAFEDGLRSSVCRHGRTCRPAPSVPLSPDAQPEQP